MDETISIQLASKWLAEMAAADGVISASERKLLVDFAKAHNLDAQRLLRMAYAIAAKVEVPEVELVNKQEMQGRIFENFVVSLCTDKSRFSLLAWRSDKFFNGAYAVENLMPDLHLRHKMDAGEVEYYIECKYRSSLPDGVLDLTSQLPRYRRMASAETNRELFIALGIGGTPSYPEQFYVIPSRMVKRDSVIKISNFSKCLCQPNGNAFHAYIEHFFNKRVFRKTE